MTTGWYEDPLGYNPDDESLYDPYGESTPGYQGDPYDDPYSGGSDYGGGAIDDSTQTGEPPGYQGDPYDDPGYDPGGDFGYGEPIYTLDPVQSSGVEPDDSGPVYDVGHEVSLGRREYDDYGFPIVDDASAGDTTGPILGPVGSYDDNPGREVFPRQNGPGASTTVKPRTNAPPGSGPGPLSPGLNIGATPRYPVPGVTSGPLAPRYPTPYGPSPTIRTIWDSGRATQSPMTPAQARVASSPASVSALGSSTWLWLLIGAALLYVANK